MSDVETVSIKNAGLASKMPRFQKKYTNFVFQSHTMATP